MYLCRQILRTHGLKMLSPVRISMECSSTNHLGLPYFNDIPAARRTRPEKASGDHYYLPTEGSIILHPDTQCISIHHVSHSATLTRSYGLCHALHILRTIELYFLLLGACLTYSTTTPKSPISNQCHYMSTRPSLQQIRVVMDLPAISA